MKFEPEVVAKVLEALDVKPYPLTRCRWCKLRPATALCHLKLEKEGKMMPLCSACLLGGIQGVLKEKLLKLTIVAETIRYKWNEKEVWQTVLDGITWHLVSTKVCPCCRNRTTWLSELKPGTASSEVNVFTRGYMCFFCGTRFEIFSTENPKLANYITQKLLEVTRDANTD